MRTTTRVYEGQKLRAKKLLGIPIPLIGILLVSGIVAAATLLGPVLGPTSQTVSIVTLSYGTGPGDGVLTPIQYAVVDTVNVDATNSGGAVTNADAIRRIAYTGGGASPPAASA